MGGIMGDYPTTEWVEWFAWYPVPLQNGKSAFMKTILRRGICYHGVRDGCSKDIWYYQHKLISKEA